MKSLGFIRNAALTLPLLLLSAALAWGQGITVSEDTESTYVPTTIINGSFNDEPWMDFVYNSTTYTLATKDTKITNVTISYSIPNGVNGGWNTTETKPYNGSLFEFSSNPQHYNSNLPAQANNCVEMNVYNSAVLYQDLRTHGHDVIRWTLKHAVRTNGGDDVQSMRVEIGAPEYSGENIVAASGINNSVDSHIQSATKAVYRSSGITNPQNATYGYNGANLDKLALNKTVSSDYSQWHTVTGVYEIPAGQAVTRFGFIAESASKPDYGNLLDDITFSTLIGNLSAQQLGNNDVELRGYWGETDTAKRLKVVLGSSTHDIDMTSVIGDNFLITIPAAMVGTATSLSVYHQDYQDATVSIVCTPAWTLTIPVTAATVLGESKYVTSFYHSTLIYQLPAGAEAYTAAKVDDNVVFYRIGTDSDIIPNNTAVVIVAGSSAVSDGKITMTRLVSTDVTARDGNILRGYDVDTAKPAGTVYVLGKNDGGVLGFYPLTGGTIPAGKAYYVVN